MPEIIVQLSEESRLQSKKIARRDAILFPIKTLFVKKNAYNVKNGDIWSLILDSWYFPEVPRFDIQLH